MSPDDRRHGTEAGHEQHVRDNETPCPACTEADLIAARRRSKRRNMGHQFTRPLGQRLHGRLLQQRARGARVEDIAEWAGISTSQVCRAIHGGPDQKVYARTWLAIARMTPRPTITDVGIQRRLQALTWMGWSAAQIAERVGMHADTVVDARNTRHHLNNENRTAIAALYDDLCMTEPAPTTRHGRAGVSRCKGHARRNGWAPPLAWDDIDHDPAPLGHDNTTDALDDVAIDRRIAGDRVPLTTAEKAEARRRWVAAGRPLNELERVTGINTHRRYEEAS